MSRMKPVCCLLAFAVLLFAAVPASAAQPFTRDIEVVVGFSAGGGSDLCARMFANIINEEHYLPVRLNVVNKPGGNSAVAMNYAAGKSGDPHYLLFITPGFVTVPLAGNSKVNYTKFTPIAIFGNDEVLVVTQPDGKFKTFEDLVKAAKANPGAIRIGGAGSGGIWQVCALEMGTVAGIDLNYVPFLGGSEVIAAVMGGHIEAALLKISEVSSFLESRQLRALVVPGVKRIATVKDVPTMHDLGYDFDMNMPRGVVAMGGISKEAVDMYAEAFRKLSENPTWVKEYCEKYQFGADFKGPEEAAAAIKKMHDVFAVNLKKLGIIK